MTTMTLTLTEFLLARIAEDEQHGMTSGGGTPLFSHARVLAECEAKRRIVELAREAEDRYGGPAEVYMDGAIEHLAAVYSDHPDWRKEWRP